MRESKRYEYYARQKKLCRDRPFHRCHKLDLPNHDHVIIFIDLEAGSKPTIASMSPGEVSIKELARLDLSRLGTIPRLLRLFGQLVILYGTPVRVFRGGKIENTKVLILARNPKVIDLLHVARQRFRRLCGLRSKYTTFLHNVSTLARQQVKPTQAAKPHEQSVAIHRP